MLTLNETVKVAINSLLPEGVVLLDDDAGGLIVWQFKGDADGDVKHVPQSEIDKARQLVRQKFAEIS